MTVARLRGAGSRPGPVALAVGLLGSLLWAVTATAFFLREPDRPAAVYLVYSAAGLTYMVAGIVGWWLRPDNRTGMLLAAIGATMFIGYLYGTGVPALDLSFAALGGLHNALLAALLLGYPSGRVDARVDRLIIVTIAVTLAIADVLASLGGGQAISVVSGLILPAVVIVRIVQRWRAATPAARRTLTPVLLGGTVLLVGIILTQVPRLLDAAPEIQLLVRYVQAFARGALPIAFLYGLLRLRMSRSAVADLVVELGDAPEPWRLRQALSTALGDPSLEVVRWSREEDSFVDHVGHPVSLPDAAQERAVTVLERDGEPLAALFHDPVLLDDPALVHSVLAALRLAVDNERLQAEVRAQLEEVRASRGRIVEAGDAERRRVERDLHDGAQQRLVSLSLSLRLARSKLRPDADPEVAAALAGASDELRTALAELRELAHGIHPTILTEAGLIPALRSLADRAAVPVELRAEVPERLPPAVEATAYFLVAEALTNAAKHANAQIVRVSAERRDGELMVCVSDDGSGGADRAAGSGLRGLEDRIAAVGGSLEIESPSSKGTTIVARIPTPTH